MIDEKILLERIQKIKVEPRQTPEPEYDYAIVFNQASVIKPSGKDVIAAASQMVNEINEQTVTWYSKQEILCDSAITSIKRPISGGWGFGGENSMPIEAAALALWGCRTSKRNPQRKMRIG